MNPKDWSGQAIISVIVVAGTFIVYGLLLGGWVKDQNMAQAIFGAATTQFALVVSYWVGSSKSSQAKDDTIAKLAGPNP